VQAREKSVAFELALANAHPVFHDQPRGGRARFASHFVGNAIRLSLEGLRLSAAGYLTLNAVASGLGLLIDVREFVRQKPQVAYSLARAQEYVASQCERSSAKPGCSVSTFGIIVDPDPAEIGIEARLKLVSNRLGNR
jgi:hypothetical protein